MNILIVSFYFSPEVGAAPLRISNLANGLKDKNLKVDVLTTLPNYPKGKIFEGYRGKIHQKENIGGVNIDRYWTYATVSKNAIKRAISMFSFALTLWLYVFKVKRILKYDYVIIQTPPLPVAVSAVNLFKKLYKRKIILNVSDLWPISGIELGAIKPGSAIHKLFLRMEKYLYGNANIIMGQSSEILKHTSKINSQNKRILYRNVKSVSPDISPRIKNKNFKIVYAGLLGVAQNIYDIIRNINFRELNVEFHIYGGGNQAEHIIKYINDNPDCNVIYHGYISPDELRSELIKYDASIVPLAVSIKGAVPSKIFDLFPLGVPVLFSGGGEGAEIINSHKTGLTSDPGDYEALRNNIQILRNLPEDEYYDISANCIKCALEEFNLEHQLNNFIKEL